MPKLTYRAQTPDDPNFVSVGPHRFEHGKGVEVDDLTYDRLKDNPWFGKGRAAREQAEASAAGGERDRLDSSVDLSMPPGSGMKYPGAELISTGDGYMPADDASMVDGANTVEADEADKPRRGRPSKN